MSLTLAQGSTVHISGEGGKRGDDGSGGDKLRTRGGGRIGGIVACVGAATEAETRTKSASGQRPEGTRIAWFESSVGVTRAAVGGKIGGGGRGGTGVGDGSGGDRDDGGSDHGVGDAGKSGKADRGNAGAPTGLLPAEVLGARVRLGATPAWASCARRWLSCTVCIPRWLVSAPVETTTPDRSGGGGGHVPHATGQVVSAIE
jgi:hypothetical protein